MFAAAALSNTDISRDHRSNAMPFATAKTRVPSGYKTTALPAPGRNFQIQN
jgi:hypothetical protein